MSCSCRGGDGSVPGGGDGRPVNPDNSLRTFYESGQLFPIRPDQPFLRLFPECLTIAKISLWSGLLTHCIEWSDPVPGLV
jgi:hypothetical protein